MKIEEIDANFRSVTAKDGNFSFFDALHQPFALEGFPWYEINQKLYRVPNTFTEKDVNQGVLGLSNHTAGGAIRFRSNSEKIAVKAVLKDSADMNHMPRTGSMGFDILKRTPDGWIHAGTAKPNPGQVDLEQVMVQENQGGMTDWILNLPLYGGVKSLEIGLLPGSELEPPTPHKIKKPILFYGSSITQGGCASRPGNAYTSMLCRALDAEQINLGFSGSGKGEPAVAQAIASLDLAAFVMDYDHNAPTKEHLQETHEPFFRIVRQAHPELPILLLSKGDVWKDTSGYQSALERRDIIRATYEHAIAAGDRHVRFISGETLFGTDPEERSLCTVDRCHPNDLGFFRMYKTIFPVLKEMLEK